jgi:hypothetical protein
MRRILVATALCLAATASPAMAVQHPPLPLNPCRAAVTPGAGPAPGLREFVGSVHEHSAYSDGYIGTTPSDYYRSGRCFGLNFLFGSDHSDFFFTPIATSDECLDRPALLACKLADPYRPLNSFQKYAATGRQADAEQRGNFTTARGFEWSSDRFGHINVYFASHWTSWLFDGLLTMKTFYSWALRPAALGGGSDGLLTFNHPGDKSACGQVGVCEPSADPGFDWEDFAYHAQLDPRMVGIETFNGGSDFGSPFAHHSGADGHYAHALDKGWHLGAIGAEDKGHSRTDRWGSDDLAKTVMIAPDQRRATLEQAMRDRRFYSTLGRGLRLDFTIDGALMGSRLRRASGAPLQIAGALTDWTGNALTGAVHLDLVSNTGAVAASAASDHLAVTRTFVPTASGSAASRWFFLRATRDGRVVAYSSPIWITR